MNYRLLCRLLGIVTLLIGLTMLFSLPWAHPALGQRGLHAPQQFETRGFVALLASVVLSAAVGGILLRLGRGTTGRLFRKEAMAVVGLSWVVATVIGALPFYLSGTYRGASVRLLAGSDQPQLFDFRGLGWQHWIEKPQLSDEQFQVLQQLLAAGARGLDKPALVQATGRPDAASIVAGLVESDPDWAGVLILPDGERAPPDRASNFRIRWIRMGLVDSLFESQSGFSTTGATVISDLEDPVLVPHCILFWRSSTHFLGGLGIIVLFVVILGQGSAGKALMRAEMPGPTKEGATARMQHTAWIFAAIYCALNLILAVILWLLKLSPFDALCHAFGTMATGGFSTYNASLGHFRSPAIDMVVLVFMILAGSNFSLLYLVLRGQPGKLLADIEWRTYMAVILGTTALVVLFGLWTSDFAPRSQPLWQQALSAVRYGMFQVVSIMTTTGYGTHDFDRWNSFGRGVLFLLMFVGGCAGSTGGGMKVIRHILFLKILRLEIEHAYHPSVVRPVRLGGRPVEDAELRRSILVYFGLILVIFVFSWMFIVAVEPDITWGTTIEHKLIDSATGVAATLNNIGPGLGTVGATQNYGHFSPLTKLLFVWLMMIGRLEIFAILVLFSVHFWRSR